MLRRRIEDKLAALGGRRGAAELKLGAVTYAVTADRPLEHRPRFVRLRVEASDGRRWTFHLHDENPFLTGAEAAVLDPSLAFRLPQQEARPGGAT